MKFKYRYDNLNKLVCFVFGYVYFYRNIPTSYGSLVSIVVMLIL